MAIPFLAQVAIGLTGAAAGQAASSVVGQPLEWLEHTFNPAIITPPLNQCPPDYASYVNNQYKFYAQVLAPSDEDIKGLDDFFESYGYNISRFRKPVLNVRSNFTYVKTKDAVVKSSIMMASVQMSAMLNNGTKFWIGDIG